jgi:glucose/arabinose dehydrogenase
MLAVTPSAVLTPTFSDPHFVDQAVWTGLNQPMTVRWATDDRAFVAEKGGVVKEFDSLSDTTPTVVVDLRTQVDNYWDRGLESIALDPNFLTGSPYLYIFIVYDAPLYPTGSYGTTAPIWNDNCPSPPGSTTDGCVVSSELLRVPVDTTTNVASGPAQVLVHDWCQQFPSHAGGAMVFDSSGNLVVTGGDGASFSGQDYGQRGGTLPNTTSPLIPLNPCNDPETVTGSNPGTVTVSTAEGGSLRAQQVRISDLRNGMSTSLDGTVIRVNPATGAGVPTNPLASSSDANQQRIMANGFRNPFRMTSRPGTDELYVGDVGDQTWEEIDMIVPPNTALTPTTIPNFGWPCYEGPAIDPAWQSLGTNLCNNLYGQANAITQPVYTYSHYNSNNPDGPCFVGDSNGKMSSSISGLAFYEGAKDGSVEFGSASSTDYKGALFFTDYSRNCLAVLFPDVNGHPDPNSMVQIASNLSHPVDLVTGAGGDLFYVDLDGGVVHRIVYHTDPIASIAPVPVFLGPGVAHLNGSASSDPDPNDYIVSWNWYLQGQSDTSGAPDATGATYDWNVPSAGVFPVRLKVVTHLGYTASTEYDVDASDAPPVPVIDTPLDSLTWTVGDSIDFSGHATDPEDGNLPAAKLSWELVIHHCPAGIELCHLHFIETYPGVDSGSFIAPDHEYPSWLELRLTATDSHNVSVTTLINLCPKTSTLSAKASVSGIQVFVDGTAQPNPPTPLTYIRGGLATVNAPVTVVSGGKRYRFVSWSDGGGAVHDVVVNPDISITATYVLDAPDTCAAATTTSPIGSWLTDYLNGDGTTANHDENWFKFTLTSTRRVVMTAGSLPVDAKLELRSSCSTVLATSDHTGTRYEQITKVLGAGTYRLHVIGNGGAHSTTPYVVRFRQLSSGAPVLSSVAVRNGSTVTVSGEVLNNTGATSGKVTVTATFLNGTKTVATLKGSAFAYRIGSGGVSPFRLSGTVPTYTSVKLTTTWASPSSGPTLVVTGVVYAAGAGGTTLEKVTVKNTGTKTAKSPAVGRTWYGPRGEVLGVGFASGSPTSLAPGKSATYTVTRPAGFTTLQAAATSWRAIL